MTPRRLKCTHFRKGILDFSLECIQLLQNDFFKQRYITFNAIIPGQDRIYPNTHLCRTFFAGYIYTIYFRYSTVWIANMEIGFNPNNSVIKRFRCTYYITYYFMSVIYFYKGMSAIIEQVHIVYILVINKYF